MVRDSYGIHDYFHILGVVFGLFLDKRKKSLSTSTKPIFNENSLTQLYICISVVLILWVIFFVAFIS